MSEDPANFPYSQEQLRNIGVLAEDAPELAKSALNFMQTQPRAFALQCAAMKAFSPPASPTLSESFVVTSFSALSISSEATVVSKYAPSNYKRVCYYNGIAGEGECPELVYSSDLTTPFDEPKGRFAKAVVKSIYGADDTPLGKVWSTVLETIRTIVKAAVDNYSSIEACRFYTHGPDGFVHNPDGVTDGGSLGPAIVWVGVPPGSTSADTAHDASQLILELLRKNGVEDAVIEWRDAVVSKLTGPPLLTSTDRNDALFQVSHFLTHSLSIPLTTEGLESYDASGTMSMLFHVTKDASGLTDKVYGLTNCHVLRDDYKTTFDFNDGDIEDDVRVCAMHRFQRGLNDITKASKEALAEADILARGLVKHEQKKDTTPKGLAKTERFKQDLQRKNEEMRELEDFHNLVTSDWSNMALHRKLGHVVYAPAVSVDVDTKFTADWGVFEADKDKFQAGYDGNGVFLGTRFTPTQLKEMLSHARTEFIYPEDGKLPLTMFAGKISLELLPERDGMGNKSLTVAKDGNTTDFTIGRFTGLEAYIQNPAGESKEYVVYNSGYFAIHAFAAKGDSGAMVFYANGGEGCIVGQLHSGGTKDGSGGAYVTYLTPGWWLQEQVQKKYPHAQFFRTTWPQLR
ncbi:hypothetical protein F5050DRAFT_1802082 [Lentinula boryana]|uniref:Uncharacterized protein n=1 Tax=Lentinula boryana TaxID=40481 RepID=A0ABQ8PYS0_9AGAR|nr:hypothetical protein F5050DRAFT_1802082 [Lentinula boryana]